MLLCDLHLAQRLEWAHNQGMIEQVETQSRLFPETGAAGMPIAGGYLCYQGEKGYVARALGLGLHGPVTPIDVDCVEQFLRTRGKRPEINVCPSAIPRWSTF